MQYCLARYRKEREERIYRIYVTDALKISAENTSRIAAGGSYLTIRFADVIEPKPEETRSPEEIISGIKERLDKIRGQNDEPV